MGRFSSRNIRITIIGNGINKTIEDLNIRIVAKKTLSSVANEAEIEIYNLNQNSREELYNNVYDYNIDEALLNVEFYNDDVLLFKGLLVNINNIYSTKDAEWKSTLYCSDGFNAFRSKIKKIFKKGSTRKEIVADLTNELESLGVAVTGAIEGFKDCTNKSVLKAITVDGKIVDNIKKLLKNCFKDVEVYIDDGKINILVNKTVIKNNRIKIRRLLLAPPTLNEQGVTCKTVLNSSLKIGAEFEIEAKSTLSSFSNLTTKRPLKKYTSGNGVYKLTEIRHTVDNYTDEVATTEIVGLNIGQTNA